MANVLIFLMNCIFAFIALIITVVCFLPSIILHGCNAAYRKLLGLDT